MWSKDKFEKKKKLIHAGEVLLRLMIDELTHVLFNPESLAYSCEQCCDNESWLLKTIPHFVANRTCWPPTTCLRGSWFCGIKMHKGSLGPATAAQIWYHVWCATKVTFFIWSSGLWRRRETELDRPAGARDRFSSERLSIRGILMSRSQAKLIVINICRKIRWGECVEGALYQTCNPRQSCSSLCRISLIHPVSMAVLLGKSVSKHVWQRGAVCVHVCRLASG